MKRGVYEKELTDIRSFIIDNKDNNKMIKSGFELYDIDDYKKMLDEEGIEIKKTAFELYNYSYEDYKKVLDEMGINSLLGQTPKLGVCTIKSELFPRK